MRKAKHLWRAVVVAALVIVAMSAVAQASVPTPPRRGQDGSTHEDWTFDTDANPAAPSTVSNPYGDPTASVVFDPVLGSGWQFDLGLGTQTGMWDLGSLGTISIDLPNRPYEGGLKEIWISVVCFEDPGWMAAPTVDIVSQGQITLLSEDTYIVEEDLISGAWNAHLSKWLIVPNPNSEQVIITSDLFGSVIDRVDIDTICVPEPATCAALLMGAPFLLLLRRRKA